MRVVSLLPSATEVLCAVGGRGLLVGRSHECDFPEGMDGLPVLTAPRTRFESAAQVDRAVRESLRAGEPLYELDTSALAGLRPDVILTQDLCEVCSIDLPAVRAAASRMSPEPRVLSLDPRTIEDVFDDMLRVGEAVGLAEEAARAVVGFRERFFRAMDYVNPYAAGPAVAFLEWADPLYVAGHWTPALIERAGGRHPLNPTKAHAGTGAGEGPAGSGHRMAGKSVRIAPEALVAAAPDVVIVCPCGLSLEEAEEQAERLRSEAWWRGLASGRDVRLAVVDGNQMFNRPGPRLVDAYEWLVGYLNSREEVMPGGFPWRELDAAA